MQTVRLVPQTKPRYSLESLLMTQSNIFLIHNSFLHFSGEQMFECHIAVHEVNLNGHVMVELVKVKYGYEITPQKCRKTFHH